MAADITIMALTNIFKKEINKIISTGNTSQNIYILSFPFKGSNQYITWTISDHHAANS